MNRAELLPELSHEQWAFLAVLAAFEIPISIDLAGYLAPLLPGPLFDLLEKTQAIGWIKKHAKNRFQIGDNLPVEVRGRLLDINTPDHLDSLAEKITQSTGMEKSDIRERLKILDKAGKVEDACECEINLASIAMGENHPDEGLFFLGNAFNRLMNVTDKRRLGSVFFPAALELSNLCFSSGQGFVGMEKFLLKALELVELLGDQRTRVLLNLHLGRLYFPADRRDEALVALSVGFEELQELGDDDIREQSAEFLGLFYFIQGRWLEALDQLDKCEKILQSRPGDFPMHFLTPILLGYCAANAGLFHRAIGSLDFYWRLALERFNPALASSIRAVLGTVLILLGKGGDGMNHLRQAKKEAEKVHNSMGMYLAGGGIALHHFLHGQVEHAYEVVKETFRQGLAAGLDRQFSSPMFLEMIYEFYRAGLEPIPGLDFSTLLERLLSGVNIDLKGVALRIQAKEFLSKGGDRSLAISNLLDSERLLEQAGDPVQLSKTILERAKLELGEGRRKPALELIRKARGVLGGYGEEFFPDEFRHLLEKQENIAESKRGGEEILKPYLEMIESIYPAENESEIFGKMLTSTSRIFGAERSGLFWFPSGNYLAHPVLRAARNLTQREVQSESFKGSLGMIRKALRLRQPVIGRGFIDEEAKVSQSVRSSMCIPIEVEGKIHGVLYYDNSYLDDAFDFSDPAILKQMIRHTNLFIEQHFHYLQVKQERNLLVSEKSLLLERGREDIIHRSKEMAALLKQADHIAGTESTVLILGETGTGKELLAKRIHERSLRAEKALIVVDAATIPENLLESELFGHERGAFTGADSRKLGRIELAHGGTLYMDEVGELPSMAQTKLLRVLQEKTFTRLGGTRSITSNFRLVAATNRNLEEEVAAGKFRQDLFYRLNVIPLYLPPLRERPEDITLLADYYIRHYAAKYKRSNLKLTGEQENMLAAYSWPGNIRELKNIIERAVLLSTENRLELNLSADIQVSQSNLFSDSPSLDEIQRRYIQYVIQARGGRISGPGGAAELLGMKRTSLYSRMRALGMQVK